VEERGREIVMALKQFRIQANRLARLGNSVVESASDADPVLATTLTANGVLTGRPSSGSIMCPAESLESRLGGVCSEVETLLSDSMI